MLAIDTSPRRRVRRLPTFLVIALVTAVLGAGGVVIAANRVFDAVQRVPDVASVLDPANSSFENYLLVGSDSRAGIDPNSPDAGGIGSEGDVSGQRSDTIMVLHRPKHGGTAALLSLPRDLNVHVPGHDGKRRINSAFSDGPGVLVRTVQELGIPVHHYVEIDFTGFKELVDAIGGVQLCFELPARDVNTGLFVPAGCQVLDGVQALAYARSRHFEQFRDNDWHLDGTADLGRIKRQQDFVDRAIQGALAEVKADPFAAGRLARSIGAALRIDGDLDPLAAAGSLRDAVGNGLATYSLPVRGVNDDGKAVLEMTDGAGAYLAYFAGTGPDPAPAG